MEGLVVLLPADEGGKGGEIEFPLISLLAGWWKRRRKMKEGMK